MALLSTGASENAACAGNHVHMKIWYSRPSSSTWPSAYSFEAQSSAVLLRVKADVMAQFQEFGI